jgi:hypothetical protein
LGKTFLAVGIVIFVLLWARAPGIGATLHTLQKKYMLVYTAHQLLACHYLVYQLAAHKVSAHQLPAHQFIAHQFHAHHYT